MKIRKTICSTFAVVFALALAACATTSTAAAPVEASGLDELSRAVRDVSDYLNDTVPAGSMIVFVNVESPSAELSDFIIDDLIANAVNDRVFTVVDRQRLDLIRAEQGFQLSGDVDDETALGIGRFFGAQTIVSGRVSALGDNFRLTIRALDVQTAQVQGQYNRTIGTTRIIGALIGSGGAQMAQAPGRQTAQAQVQQPGRATIQVPTQAPPPPAPAPAQPTRPEVIVEGGTLAERLQWIEENAAHNTLYHIEISADETLAPQILSFARARNVTVRLASATGEELFIALYGNGALFTVAAGVTFILDNGITLEGHNRNNSSLVVVRGRAELVMNDGVNIVGNNFTVGGALHNHRGGGVRVNEHGIFTMNGGEISGNSSNIGGGVYVSGQGRFTMAGGIISGNRARSYRGGGGVNVSSGAIFNKTGGTIYGSDGGINANWAHGNGHAIGGGRRVDATARL
ncbi:MAG: CsgG/HfaB family protein [Treponema sp.]|nr:CsgG/HfaB family protein [Treponema sp.]